MIVTLKQYTYQQERADDVLDMVDLIRCHRDAVPAELRGAFKVNRSFYLMNEEHGHLMTFSVRDDQNTIVGYAFVLVSESHHHAGSVQAIVDAFYIDPAHSALATSHFLNYMDTLLAEFGVTDVYHLVPVEREWGAILMRKGFSKVQHLYHKAIN